MDVAILGCGYVGLAAGAALASAGHRVIGVRRSDDGLRAVEAAGLNPIRADVTDPERLAAVPDVDVIVFAASSGGGDTDAARAVYVEGLETVVDEFSGRDDPPDRLVYTSSTGVYGDHGGDWVDEESELRPSTEKTRVLVSAERIALGAVGAGIEPTIARLGGVYGPGRYRIERYLDGPVTEGYVNLVHRDDAGSAIRFLVESNAPETVVVVDDEPVWKPDLAAWLAERCGVEPPETLTLTDRLADDDLPSGSGRRIRGQKRCSNGLLRSLGYEFVYPTYREGYLRAVDRFSPD